jgi:hypothetical protein
MDHGHMDHGMPGMGDGPKCSMNVSFYYTVSLDKKYVLMYG